MIYHRNDYCPCGSGKKYKNCHFGKEDPVVAKPIPSRKTKRNSEKLDPETGDVMSPEYWAEMSKRLPSKMRSKLGPLLVQAKYFAEHEAERERIGAAGEVLEAYRDEYEKLIANEVEYFRRAEALFSEDRFADLRFNAADAQRAFEVVGYPPLGEMDEKFGKVLVAAIGFLTDETQRRSLSLKLLQNLPDYVEAGRYMDAWIIQHNVDLTAEFSEDTVGPFLMTLFLFGLREWESQREQEQVAMFKELGVSPEDIQSVGYDGAESFIQKMMNDPAKTKALEVFLANHPELDDLNQAQCGDAEDAALELLEQEEAKCLFIPSNEAAPWLEIFKQKLLKATRKYTDLSKPQTQDKAGRAFIKILFDVAAQMAESIFVPFRIERLRLQILEFRKEFAAAEDSEFLEGIHGALMALQSKDDVKANRFLVAVCAYSLQDEVDAVVGEYEE